MDIISILGSVVSGGITGVLGSAITSVMAYKTKQLDYKHDLDMEVATRDTMKEEWAQRTKIAEVEGQTQITVADMNTLAASLAADKATYSTGLTLGHIGTALMVTVDFLRGIIRPAATILFTIMTFIIYARVQSRVDVAGTSPTALMDLLNQIVTVILYLSTTTVCWWFGARGISTKSNQKE